MGGLTSSSRSIPEHSSDPQLNQIIQRVHERAFNCSSSGFEVSPRRVVIFGMKDAGKTTLLRNILLNHAQLLSPNIYPAKVRNHSFNTKTTSSLNSDEFKQFCQSTIVTCLPTDGMNIETVVCQLLSDERSSSFSSTNTIDESVPPKQQQRSSIMHSMSSILGFESYSMNETRNIEADSIDDSQTTLITGLSKNEFVLSTFDLTDFSGLQSEWAPYWQGTCGIIFIVSVHHRSIFEIRNAFKRLIMEAKMQSDCFQKVPMLILLNDFDDSGGTTTHTTDVDIDNKTESVIAAAASKPPLFTDINLEKNMRQRMDSVMFHLWAGCPSETEDFSEMDVTLCLMKHCVFHGRSNRELCQCVSRLICQHLVSDVNLMTPDIHPWNRPIRFSGAKDLQDWDDDMDSHLQWLFQRLL